MAANGNGNSITWATLSTIVAVIVGLIGLTNLARKPLEERVEALRLRIETLEGRAFVRLDGIEERLGKLERRNGHEPENR